MYNKVFYLASGCSNSNKFWTVCWSAAKLPERVWTLCSSCAKRPVSEATSPDKLQTKAGLKQFAQVEEHIWDVFTPFDIDATDAVNTDVVILVADIVFDETVLAIILPEVPSKVIVACVFDVPLGERSIFCK